MSHDYDQHILLHHLDDPLRILQWTLDEAGVIFGASLFGLGIEHPFLGILVAGGLYAGLRQVKRRFGLRSLRHALYWHFPKNKRQLPNCPPSYIREYVG